MSDHVLDQESIVCLTGEPRKLNASVSAESFRASSDSIATHIHFAVKNRPFTVTIGSNGKTENASLNNLRWVATVVRFDPDASSHNQAAAFQETEDVIHVLHDNGYNALNSLETIIHPHAKPTLKQTSNRSSSHVTLEVRLQLLTSKAGCGFRLMFAAVKTNGSFIPGFWALTEPLKVVSKPDQAHRDEDAMDKKVKPSPYEIIAASTTRTQESVDMLVREVQSLRDLVRQQTDPNGPVQKKGLKKRDRATMETTAVEHKTPASLEGAFENFLLALEAEDPALNQTPGKLRKVIDGYLARTQSPQAIRALQIVADVTYSTAAAFGDGEQTSEEMTEDEELFKRDSFPSHFESQVELRNSNSDCRLNPLSSSDFQIVSYEEPFASMTTA